MIHFIIPGFYENFIINTKLLDLIEHCPYMFYDDIDIEAIYGVFPFNVFDGGRIFREYSHATIEEVQLIKHIFNDKAHISLRQVCTNPVITPEYYTDRFANLCLAICEDPLNEIIINNDGLKEYIKANYPKYTFISSTTKCLSKIDSFKEELNNPDYKIICLDYNLNHNWKMLEQLTQEEKDKCEFLCNAICPPGCIERKMHYKFNGLFALGYGDDYKMEYCGVNATTVSEKVRNFSNNIPPEELYNKYVPMGFSHFKIEGRTLSTFEVAANYAYYMAKPEYHDELISTLTMHLSDHEFKVFNQTF